ncbi:hypothetical protein [Cochlodiniinecator piscidefendens]|nr:hypothetical protein [Cochlodiniinecator piscidefendens]
MLKDVKTVAARSAGTLVQDAVGLCALIVMLVAGLYLPGSL